MLERLRRRRLSRIAAIALLGLGASCVGPVPSDSGGPPASADATPVTQACPSMELRSPAGNPVNLTGTWYGDDPAVLYYFWQAGACVWWAGGFATSATSPATAYDGLGIYTTVFAGRISPDFRIRGMWSVVRTRGTVAANPDWGTIEIQINFTGSGEDETVELSEVGGSPEHHDTHWTRISETDIPPP